MFMEGRYTDLRMHTGMHKISLVAQTLACKSNKMRYTQQPLVPTMHFQTLIDCSEEMGYSFHRHQQLMSLINVHCSKTRLCYFMLYPSQRQSPHMQMPHTLCSKSAFRKCFFSCKRMQQPCVYKQPYTPDAHAQNNHVAMRANIEKMVILYNVDLLHYIL